MSGLHVVDYVIFTVTLVASFCIGIYHAYISRRKETVDHYLIANRKMKLIPVSLSLVISTFSAIALLGDAEEIYFYGVEYWFIAISYPISVTIVAFVAVPLLYPLKIKSPYEVSKFMKYIFKRIIHMR